MLLAEELIRILFTATLFETVVATPLKLLGDLKDLTLIVLLYIRL